MLITNDGSKHNIHLISFADGNPKYNNAKEKLINDAKQFELFDSIKVYNFNDLDHDFKMKHIRFIAANKRGFGYWIWKPYIIWKTLEKIPEGDILLYVDVCTLLNPKLKNHFIDYLNILLKSEDKNLFIEFDNLINQWCKMDTIKALNAEDIYHLKELASGIIFTSNNKKNRDFFEKMYITMTDYHLIDDSPSILENLSCFRENRHDQTIFSILARKEFSSSIYPLGSEILNDPFNVIVARGNNYVYNK